MLVSDLHVKLLKMLICAWVHTTNDKEETICKK